MSPRRLFLILTLFAALVCAGMQAQTSAAPAKTQQFYMKLIPPRPTFAQDMTPKEADLMKQHAAYWAGLFQTHKVWMIGPVLDPKGTFGFCVLDVADETEARLLANGDPTVKAGLNIFELAPMRVFHHE